MIRIKNNDILATKPAANEELIDILCQGKEARIERIVSCGQISPPGFWYDQDEDEWLLLLQGAAGISFADGSSCYLKEHQYLFLPAHRKHRVEYTSSAPPCIWLCVFGHFREKAAD